MEVMLRSVVPLFPAFAFISKTRNVEGDFVLRFRNSFFEKTSSLVYIAWKEYQTRKVYETQNMCDVDLAREQARERGARGNQRSRERVELECHRRGIGRGGREGRGEG